MEMEDLFAYTIASVLVCVAVYIACKIFVNFVLPYVAEEIIIGILMKIILDKNSEN